MVKRTGTPTPTVVVRRGSDVTEIVLSRPDKLNAMDMAWVHDLNAAVAAVAADPGPSVVVVRGVGRAFCSGLDLDMMAEQGMPPDFFNLQEAAFVGLEQLDRVVIAQIHGYCLGGGLQLAIACDIRVASDDAVLSLPAAFEGLPAGMAPWRLPRFIGLGRALRLAISGERLTAADAFRLGLVDHVLPADGFDALAGQIARRYATVPRAAARAIKTIARSSFDADFGPAYEQARTLVEECLASPDVAAARRAWVARRKSAKEDG